MAESALFNTVRKIALLWIPSFLTDARHALRGIRNTPAALIAVASIAVSVGATAVVFAAIKTVLIDTLPYQHADELIQIRTVYPKADRPSQADWMFWKDLQEVIRNNVTLQSIGVYRNALFTLAGDENTFPEALFGERVSASLFPMLGVSPMLGRNILPEEDTAGHSEVIILSYGLWVRHFDSGRGIVGRTIRMNGHDCVVIGVMPGGFDFPLRKTTSVRTPLPYMEFWAPLQIDPGGLENGLGAIGRLRPGVTLAAAQQDLAALGEDLARRFPNTNRDHTFRAGLAKDRALGSASRGLWLLMATALLFMLIGCSNVANLMLARGLSRDREIAVRLALGARPGRIIRQLLTESCVLALLGGLSAYCIVVLAWRVLPAIVPVTIPRLAASRADSTVLVFALGMSLLNGILFGIVPALRAAAHPRPVALAGLGARGAGGNRLRSGLIAAEVALAMILVILGGQLLASFARLLTTDPGFSQQGLMASVIIPTADQYQRPENRTRFFERILDSVDSIPGVDRVGTVDALPFSGENHGGYVSTTDAAVFNPNGQEIAEVDVVSSDYLQAMGARLLEGRWFEQQDMGDKSDFAIVDEFAARRFWPGRSPIGQHVCINCLPGQPRNWRRVVGMVSSMHHMALDGPPSSSVYLAQSALSSASFLLVRTNRPEADMAFAIRRAVSAIDPNQPVFLTASLSSWVADSIADRRFIMTLLAALAFLALAMSAAGVYGVIAYTTSRRTQEIGIRMAVGATPLRIHALIFGQGFLAVAGGLIFGLAAALILLRTLRGWLAGLGADPIRVIIAIALVTVAAALACWIPARRATQVDPMSALRAD